MDQVLLYSVLVFIVVPLIAGVWLRQWFMRTRGRDWFEQVLLPRFAPVSGLRRDVLRLERKDENERCQQRGPGSRRRPQRTDRRQLARAVGHGQGWERSAA